MLLASRFKAFDDQAQPSTSSHTSQQEQRPKGDGFPSEKSWLKVLFTNLL
jgi:hypothetical protein